MMSAIKQVILQSRLSKAEKEDIFANLVEPGAFVADVTKRQKEDRTESDESPNATNGRGGIDYE